MWRRWTLELVVWLIVGFAVIYAFSALVSVVF